MTPYEILGVPRTASDREIKAAHRRLAKLHHPDVGGDVEAFQRIQAAYDLLSDPARRARFDATGDESVPITVDPVRKGAIGVISDLIASVVMQNTEDEKLFKVDLADTMRQAVNKELESLTEGEGAHRRALARIGALRGRFTKARGEGDNILDSMLATHEQWVTDAFDRIEARRTILQAALSMIGEYDFRQDVPAPEPITVYQQQQGGLGRMLGLGL